MARSFDAIVIGAGQAGPPLAARLAQRGKRVLLVEREHVGGTCVNDGCTPTKAMVASARVAHLARHASDWGISTGSISVDMAAVKGRKDTVVQSSIDSLRKWISSTENLTYLCGHARFTAPRTIEVGTETFRADMVFINAGGRARIPLWPGLADSPYLTNATMMDLDQVPSHLVVVGGSYIGLEFAQMFRRFGARVSLLEQGERLIAREDPDISDAVRAILEAEGIEIHTGVGEISVSNFVEGPRLGFVSGGAAREIGSSHLLVATGRRPNTDDLGLDRAGVAIDEKGFVVVDDTLRTSAEGVWALGDVNGRGAFTHTSYNDFEIVAANLLDGERRSVSDRIPVYGLFIDPPLARIGMNEAQARTTARKVLRGTMPMARIGRARERGETRGFLKILIDAESRLFLGASFLGIESDEAIHGVLDLMAAKVPYTSLQRTMHIHPTVSELIPTLLGDLEPLTD